MQSFIKVETFHVILLFTCVTNISVFIKSNKNKALIFSFQFELYSVSGRYENGSREVAIIIQRKLQMQGMVNEINFSLFNSDKCH